MNRSDAKLLKQSNHLLARAALLGSSPEVLAALGALRSAQEALSGSFAPLAAAKKEQSAKLRAVRAEQRGLYRCLGGLAEAVSRAKIGRLNAPFFHLGGPKLSEIYGSNANHQVVLMRQALARLAAQPPVLGVVRASQVCEQQCQAQEAAIAAWGRAYHQRAAAQKACRDARRSWHKALRALKRAVGIPARLDWWQKLPDTLPIKLLQYAADLAEHELRMEDHQHWVMWTERANEARAKLGMELRPPPEAPVPPVDPAAELAPRPAPVLRLV